MKNLKQYQLEFSAYQGNELCRVKSFIEEHVERWSLEGDESLVVDMLDDRNITADDILAALESIVSYQEDNAEFKNGVLAIRLGLEKARLSIRKKVTHKEQSSGGERHEATHSLDDYGTESGSPEDGGFEAFRKVI